MDTKRDLTADFDWWDKDREHRVLYFTTRTGKTYHIVDKHRGLTQYDVYRNTEKLEKYGYKPCKRCVEGR